MIHDTYLHEPLANTVYKREYIFDNPKLIQLNDFLARLNAEYNCRSVTGDDREDLEKRVDCLITCAYVLFHPDYSISAFRYISSILETCKKAQDAKFFGTFKRIAISFITHELWKLEDEIRAYEKRRSESEEAD